MTTIPCVGAIVFDQSRRLLLVRRANPPAQGTWSIPGGRVEPDETAEQAVLRELAEETGLVGRIEREVGSVQRAAPGGGIYDIRDFVVRVDAPAALRAADDAADARWFTYAELVAAPTSPGLVEALTTWGVLPA